LLYRIASGLLVVIAAGHTYGWLTYGPHELTVDFAILRNALTSGDPGIYRYISPTTLDASFVKVRAMLNRPELISGGKT